MRPLERGGGPDDEPGGDVHAPGESDNRMFYFLAQGSNAGKGSDFTSPYLVKKPLAMTGIGSKEDKAVQRAYAAINVGADIDE